MAGGVPMDVVKWLEVALYWEQTRPRGVPAGDLGAIPDGAGDYTLASPETMKYIISDTREVPEW